MVATMSVVVGGHNGAADPLWGTQAAPVLPLVSVDRSGVIMTLDGDSSPKLPRHWLRGLQSICSLQQAQGEEEGRFPSCLLVGDLLFSGLGWGISIHINPEIRSPWTSLLFSLSCWCLEVSFKSSLNVECSVVCWKEAVLISRTSGCKA